jgi:hypothetical protein
MIGGDLSVGPLLGQLPPAERRPGPAAPEAVLTADPDRIDADACLHQPFFASPEAAASWLAGRPAGRSSPSPTPRITTHAICSAPADTSSQPVTVGYHAVTHEGDPSVSAA